MIVRVATGDVAAVWPDILPLIRRGLAKSAGMMTEEQLRAGLAAEVLQLWADPLAPVMAITMISKYPELRVVSVVLLSGREMSSWLGKLTQVMESFAREQGCTALEALVRPGLAGASYDSSRAALQGWHPMKTMMRRQVAP